MVSSEYLILFIQDNTEDLCAVSLLDAGPPRNREHVMVLGGVAVFRKGLLCERETNGGIKRENTGILLQQIDDEVILKR